MTDTRDAVMYLSAHDAGQSEIEEFLRCGGKAPAKRLYKRIMKRIKHASLYSGGKMTVMARILAWIMILMLAAFFVLCGFFAYLLAAKLSDKDTELTFTFFSDKAAESEKTVGITVFKSPVVPGAISSEVLLKSSLAYNIKYETANGTIYYIQKPIPSLEETEDDENTEEYPISSDALCVLVGDNRGFVTIADEKSGKLFDITWSDNDCIYSISGASAMEEAVKLAKSVRTEADEVH